MDEIHKQTMYRRESKFYSKPIILKRNKKAGFKIVLAATLKAKFLREGKNLNFLKSRF